MILDKDENAKLVSDVLIINLRFENISFRFKGNLVYQRLIDLLLHFIFQLDWRESRSPSFDPVSCLLFYLLDGLHTIFCRA